MTTDMHKAPSVAGKALNCPDTATPVARYDLSTSEGARRYIADFFATELRRHDFARYINARLAADFACALAQHLAATGKQQAGEVQGDALYIEWLKERISSIYSTVSLGHQTGPYAYAGEDFSRHLTEAASDCRKIMRVLSALAAHQPVGYVPDGVWEALQRIIENSALHGPASNEDAILVARYRRHLLAAPPAQGIDLGQLRALAEKFESYGDDEIGDAFSGPYYQCAAELRGLIDGQRDAAPGVANA